MSPEWLVLGTHSHPSTVVLMELVPAFIFHPPVYTKSPRLRLKEEMNDHQMAYHFNGNDSFVNACCWAGCGYSFLWSWHLVGKKAGGSGTQGHPLLHSKLGTVQRYTRPCLKIKAIKMVCFCFFENGILKMILLIFAQGRRWLRYQISKS